MLRGGLGALAAIAVVVSLVGALSADAAGGGQVYFPSKCMGGKVKPKLVVLGCGDFNFYVNKLDWRNWGGRRTTGRGVAHVNNCNPSCAGGTFHKYRGKLRLHKIKLCPQDDRRHYTKAVFSFRGDRPNGSPHRFKQPFPCSFSG
ncbi:MAG: hypothetical protein QOJ01_269 [Solirubrobacterales bacterium]|nr:hypothetical protein [Solirubrobacterales bacterium]